MSGVFHSVVHSITVGWDSLTFILFSFYILLKECLLGSYCQVGEFNGSKDQGQGSHHGER